MSRADRRQRHKLSLWPKDRSLPFRINMSGGQRAYGCSCGALFMCQPSKAREVHADHIKTVRNQALEPETVDA